MTAAEPIDAELVEAEVRLGRLDTGSAHELATRALEAGDDVPAIYELLAVERDRLGWEAGPLLDRLLRQLGQRELTEAEAWLVLARRVAASFLDGEFEADHAAWLAVGLWVESEHPAFVPAARLYAEFELGEAIGDSRRERRAVAAMRRWAVELAARPDVAAPD